MIKKLISAIILVPALLVPAIPALAYDFLTDSGLSQTAEGTGHADIGITMDTATGSLGNIIAFILSFIGVIFLVLMIYGGYVWMASAGNDQEVERAKKIIRNSIIGLILVLAAYGITLFIGSQLSGELAL